MVDHLHYPQKEKSLFQGKVGAGEEGEGVDKKGGAEC